MLLPLQSIDISNNDYYTLLQYFIGWVYQYMLSLINNSTVRLHPELNKYVYNNL